jgi:hypothetical protein
VTPKFKFVIYQATLYPGGIEVNTPIGWNEAVIGPERHKDFHSLVEVFEGSFIWFGVGRNVILNIESTLGADAVATLKIYMSYGGPWMLLTEQALDISQHQDIGFHNKQYESDVPIVRDDFWTKFLNRFSTPVDVLSTTDKDGNAVAAAVPFTLQLPGQKIRQRYNGESVSSVQYLFIGPDNYLGVGESVPLNIFTNVLLNEVETLQSNEVKAINSGGIIPLS